VGAAIGAFQGSFIAFLGVPSFVVTLAGLLIWQGVILKALGTQGVIGIEEHQINDIANYVLTKNWGWAVATVFTVGYAAAVFGTIFSRRRAGLPSRNTILSAARVAFYGALAVAVCNHSRGVPLVGLIVLSRGSPQ
jgi:D-xylose transport system permease protein